MASIIFNSALDDALRALIDFDTDTFKCMLVTSSYVPNKDTDTKRSDVTDEVVGAGYIADGAAANITVTKDTVNDRIDIGLGAVSWGGATITARGAVYYKSRGGAASADELVSYIDFGGDIISTAGTFSLSASTLRIQN
jgi:hypothetical protein